MEHKRHIENRPLLPRPEPTLPPTESDSRRLKETRDAPKYSRREPPLLCRCLRCQHPYDASVRWEKRCHSLLGILDEFRRRIKRLGYRIIRLSVSDIGDKPDVAAGVSITIKSILDDTMVIDGPSRQIPGGVETQERAFAMYRQESAHAIGAHPRTIHRPGPTTGSGYGPSFASRMNVISPPDGRRNEVQFVELDQDGRLVNTPLENADCDVALKRGFDQPPFREPTTPPGAVYRHEPRGSYCQGRPAPNTGGYSNRIIFDHGPPQGRYPESIQMINDHQVSNGYNGYMQGYSQQGMEPVGRSEPPHFASSGMRLRSSAFEAVNRGPGLRVYKGRLRQTNVFGHNDNPEYLSGEVEDPNYGPPVPYHDVSGRYQGGSVVASGLQTDGNTDGIRPPYFPCMKCDAYFRNSHAREVHEYEVHMIDSRTMETPPTPATANAEGNGLKRRRLSEGSNNGGGGSGGRGSGGGHRGGGSGDGDGKRSEGDLRYKCGQCDMRYSNQKALSSHINQEHDTGGPSVKCGYCGALFWKNCELKQHITVHTSTESLTCTECGTQFDSNEALIRHYVELHEDAI